MEISKPPDVFNTAENNNKSENKSLPLVGKGTSLFSATQEFKLPGISSKAIRILDSNILLVFMLIVTFYALFSDDIRVSQFSKADDDGFFALSCCALSFFSIEMIMSFIFKPDYRWSFYFWLDLIATLSIIPDIDWAWNPIVGIGSSSSSSSNVNQIQNAGKSSRAGARAARVIRIVRLVRLMRIAKLYKHAKRAVKTDSVEQVANDDTVNIPKESRVGRKLSDIITKRVIILVMVVLILIPLFDLDFYKTQAYSWDYGLEAVDDYYDTFPYEDTVRVYYRDYFKDSSRPLVYTAYIYPEFPNGIEWSSDSVDINSLREIEKYYAHTNNSIAVYDIRIDSRLEAQLNACKTIFVCIVLVAAAIFFTNDANKFAIIPIEKMINKVKAIASNPLKIAEEKVVDIYDVIEEESKSRWKKFCKGCKKSSKEGPTEYETKVLENTFVKIGVLLALGFGEAGASIISSNVKSGGDVDPLIKGKKIAAVFGFCDIRNFTDATEELQEGVMLFVNELARIVHSTVDHFCGAANKNIGDAFLVVWKFDDEEVQEFADPIIFNQDSKQVGYLGDLALMSFLKIMVKINKDPIVLKYRSNAKLVKRMPGYQVKFGFGLHLGWAIEGAIGSNFKIDASYLSHHVNMSSNLEGLTKNYGIPILLTDRVYNVLSQLGKRYCRHVDTISLKGGRDVYKLFTSDVDFSGIMPGKYKDNSKERTKNKRRALKFRLDQGVLESSEAFGESKEIALIKKPFTDEFFEAHATAMKEYLDGNWKEALGLFKNVLKYRENDGPSNSIIAYMEENNFNAPQDWKGIRPLY
ncbi:hypothetical protein SteCoe_23946 [Stentor coeruleus]|uniref:Guanylate cyclase domain-containing protein n=1 Tax=Stentor coeruleus TaxID=5963 RepID=A0A1R2BIN1_9CILI|nr:hypothetical protein SteCoe_23946 [Stentor coeruleus]